MSDSDVMSDHSSDPTDQDKDADVDDDIAEDDGSSDSESETETEDDPKCIVWTGYGKRTPVLVFKAEILVHKRQEVKAIGERYHLAYKMVKTECKLIRSILASHGFHEAHPNSSDFNLMWTGTHLKPYTLRSLQEFQKVNHFPRSYEITRKDRLYKNLQRMQQTKGYKHFDFVPQSFIVPAEFQDFCGAFLKDKGPWIVKPIASSRGRGIFLVNHPEQVPLDETLIVSRYVGNPLLIDGFKFDVRLYVAVTSYDPLIVYMYEEGLTRFATVQYDKAAKHIRNQCMHLTNYSVNKKNADYVKNDDPDVEDYGNKWSLGAMLRYLRSQGRDTTALMMRMEDVVIKTLISAELPIATACKMFMPFRGNCFEIYGFDILVDENLRPWVLEVNLSPSLACDSPLDLKIKSNMIADIFSLSGFICQDPMMRKIPQNRITGKRAQSALGRPRSSYSQRSATLWLLKKSRPQSAGGSSSKGTSQSKGSMSGLTSEEIKIVRRSKEEYARRGGWVRIFPSPDSWELYGSYFQFQTTHNWTLFQQLFPERSKNVSQKPTTASFSSSLSRTRSIHLHSAAYPQLHLSSEVDESMANALQRSLQYERKLSCLGSQNRRRRNERKNLKACPKPAGAIRGTLVQGVPEDTTDSQKQVANSQKPPAKKEATNSVTTKPPVPNSAKDKEKTSTQLKETPKENPKEVKSASQELPKKESTNESPPMEKIPPPPVVNKSKEPPPPPLPKYNVVDLLTKGKTMSKVQARFAFATYLTRVQHRLVAETGGTEQEDMDSANEQMDLVLRFLKRAAGNLQQPFKVTVPSRKLPINDRRRILAKQLGDFVHIYNKETDLLRQRQKIEKDHIRKTGYTKNDSLDEDKFTTFVVHATESELEEVLTTYTKLNKSASIFLGSNSKSSYEHKMAGGTTNSGSDTGLAKRREDYKSDDTSRNNFINTQNNHHMPHDHMGHVATVRPASSGLTMATSNSKSSYASAVAIYSAKTKSIRARPMSASSQRSSVHASVRARPLSASTLQSHNAKGPNLRERPGSTDPGGRTEVDEEAVNMALQRIANRQQQRQYSASKGTILLHGEHQQGEANERLMHHHRQSWASGPLQQDGTAASIQTNVEGYKAVVNSFPSNHSPNTAAYHNSAYSSKPFHRTDSEITAGKDTLNIPENSSTYLTKNNNNSVNGYVTQSSASDTFKHFVEDGVPYYDSDSVAAYNQVTGVPSSGTYSPSKGSTQYYLAQQQQFSRHQNLMEQSRVLLEQSRAKHQAMVAQAHTARKDSYDSDSTYPSQPFMPKPPPKPSSVKKPSSAHRMVRASMIEDVSVPGHFYNSVKYDSNTGVSRPVYNSGINT